MTSKPFAFMDIPSVVDAVASTGPRLLLFFFLPLQFRADLSRPRLRVVMSHVVRPYKADMMEGQGADTVIPSIIDAIAQCAFAQKEPSISSLPDERASFHVFKAKRTIASIGQR